MLQARLGVATGVVGDVVGEGAAREEAVVGETPNLAARLQQLAEPGTVILADSTRRLLAQLFHLRDLGARALHGFPAPVRAWQVAGEGRTTGRFEARHSGDLTPLVGREHEVALLLDRWRLAHEGEGQAVLLAGEPGVGKSRLAQTVRQRLGDERLVRLLYQSRRNTRVGEDLPVAGARQQGGGDQRSLPGAAARPTTAGALVGGGPASLPAPPLEGFHGEAKTWHGLVRAVRRGLDNMRIQAFLTAAAINLKRLAAALLAVLLALWSWITASRAPRLLPAA